MDFKSYLAKLNINITPVMEEQFQKYYLDLIEVNKVMNLTAITEETEVYIKHFYDSLSLSLAYDFSAPTKLCDVGSGAGFPAIPLAIVFPNLNVTIIDALGKRINFLNEEITKLGLKNAQAIHARAEEFVINNREKFDCVTARAVAKLNMLAE